jgi:hypothetical protein
LLVIGALLSLLLRVSVLNFKRKRQLYYQLKEAAKLISAVSAEVDSNLRVLLGVERRALDQIRDEVWAFWPSYTDSAQRVEQGLPKLKKRIDAVQALDAASSRMKMLREQGAAPTRLEQIGGLLKSVSDTLQQDQLSDEDWVFVNQRLESAQKFLREPTQTEKEAFEAMLVGRWVNVRDHFGLADDGALRIPDALGGLEGCFPDPSLLPRASDDKDGSKWVKSVGPERADLQLSALALLWHSDHSARQTRTKPQTWAR